MAELRNCKRCGRIFNYLGSSPICATCKEDDEHDFQRVKKYLYENPRATISEVASELDISIEKIRKFLREERLEIVGEGGLTGLECEKCGVSIKTGRFCDDCNKDLALGFSNAARKIEQDVKGRDGSGGFKYLSRIIKGDNQNKKTTGK